MLPGAHPYSIRMRRGLRDSLVVGSLLSLLWTTAFRALSAPAEPDSPAAEDATPATHPSDEHVWELTPYLTGTAAQVRDRLNGETERFMLLIKQKNQEITETTANIDAAQKADVERVHKTAAYIKLQAELKVAEAAHQAATGADRLDASAKANKVRAAMTKLELDVTRADASLNDDKTHLKDLKASLTKHQEALKKAKAWRDQLLEAIRNTFMLRAPVKEGDGGILGAVLPREIQPAGRVLFDYDAPELLEKGKNQEGLFEYNVIIHKVKVLVSGLDTASLKVGKSVTLDRYFTVEGILRDGAGEPLYLLRPRQVPSDHLFEVIVPLRDTPAR